MVNNSQLGVEAPLTIRLGLVGLPVLKPVSVSVVATSDSYKPSK